MDIPFPISVAPGIIKEQSDYASGPRYTDGNMVRFWKGKAERWKSWDSYTENLLDNPARGALTWVANDGTKLIAWGTATGLYLYKQGVIYNITPTGLPAGLVDSIADSGWDQKSWGVPQPWGGGYGTSGQGLANSGRARTWSLSKWGEDLIASPRGGTIYQWSKATGTGVVAQPLLNAPSSCLASFVADDRRVIALGAHDGVTYQPLRISWSSQESLTTWAPLLTNTAGDLKIEEGNEIVGYEKIIGGYLIFTDVSVHPMRPVPRYVYGVDRKGAKSGLIAPHGSVEMDGIAHWMGNEHFYSYNGVVTPMACDVHKYVFDDINRGQASKVFGGVNKAYREMIWFYPSAASIECDRFVAYSADGWSIGKLARTTWIDTSAVTPHPLATGPDGRIYLHDTRQDNDIAYSLETGQIEMGRQATPQMGETYTLIKKVVPDYRDISGTHSLTIEARRYPNDPTPMVKGPYPFDATTQMFNPKARGMTHRFLMAGTGFFRMGNINARGTFDGGRG